MKHNQLSDVFGLTRGLPLTYVSRTSVDDRFVYDVTRDKHIVVHGSSKQGKSSLRKYHLSDEDYVAIQCTRDTNRLNIYSGLLKHAGVRLVVSETERSGTSTTVSGAGKGSGGLPFVGKASFEVGAARESSDSTEVVTKELEIDLLDPNDIARVLTEAKFDRFVVIEDFHYLDEEVQRALAFDLKVLHENSAVVFIVVGVWLETNRLIMFNGDLTGRVSTINVDRWEADDLRAVIAEGEPLLNVQFDDDAKAAIVDGCEGNVGLLQEVCYRVCEAEGVTRTLENHRVIGSRQFVEETLADLAEGQAARYLNALADFPRGFGTTELEMYRWIAWVIVRATPAELRHGIKANEVFQRIAEAHPDRDRLLRNNVIQALERVESVQHRHLINPPIWDYSNRTLRVVDAQFLVFLRTQPLDQVLEAIGDPAAEL